MNKLFETIKKIRWSVVAKMFESGIIAQEAEVVGDLTARFLAATACLDINDRVEVSVCFGYPPGFKNPQRCVYISVESCCCTCIKELNSVAVEDVPAIVQRAASNAIEAATDNHHRLGMSCEATAN